MSLLATTFAALTQTSEVSEDFGCLACTVAPIDAALHDHVSQRYWDWRRLYDAAPHAAPIGHPDYVLGEVRHAPPSRLESVLVGAHRQSECVGIGALVPKAVSSKRLGSLGVNQRWHGMRLAGNDWLKPSSDIEVTADLLAAALEHTQSVRARFLLIEDLDVASSLATALSRVLPPAWLSFHHAGVQPRRRIQLPVDQSDYWNRFSKKTLSTLRRKRKKFGETRLERITDVTQIARFLEVAHEISRQTWQTRQFGLRVRNDAVELELMTILARHGLLRSYLWFSNDEPVAFMIGHQDKGCFHYEEVGYATSFAKFSPGQMLLVQVLDDLWEHDRPEWFDFGGGDADYKQLFSNHESRSGTVWLFPPTGANRFAVGYLRASLAARRWGRRAIVSGGWGQKARQWLRYTGARRTATEDVN